MVFWSMSLLLNRWCLHKKQLKTAPLAAALAGLIQAASLLWCFNPLPPRSSGTPCASWMRLGVCFSFSVFFPEEILAQQRRYRGCCEQFVWRNKHSEVLQNITRLGSCNSFRPSERWCLNKTWTTPNSYVQETISKHQIFQCFMFSPWGCHIWGNRMKLFVFSRPTAQSVTSMTLMKMETGLLCLGSKAEKRWKSSKTWFCLMFFRVF